MKSVLTVLLTEDWWVDNVLSVIILAIVGVAAFKWQDLISMGNKRENQLLFSDEASRVEIDKHFSIESINVKVSIWKKLHDFYSNYETWDPFGSDDENYEVLHFMDEINSNLPYLGVEYSTLCLQLCEDILRYNSKVYEIDLINSGKSKVTKEQLEKARPLLNDLTKIRTSVISSFSNLENWVSQYLNFDKNSQHIQLTPELKELRDKVRKELNDKNKARGNRLLDKFK